MAIDSAFPRSFTFTVARSLYVECGSALGVESTFTVAAGGGMELMPPGEYGFSKRFGWVQVNYGVRWKLDLPQSCGLAARNLRGRSTQTGEGVPPDSCAP